jgi:hypothetical protein
MPNYEYTPWFIDVGYANYGEETLQVVLYTQCVGNIFVSFYHDMFLRNLYYTIQKQLTRMLDVAPTSLLLHWENL